MILSGKKGDINRKRTNENVRNKDEEDSHTSREESRKSTDLGEDPAEEGG